MSTMIPNENCWVGFSDVLPVSAALIPKAAELAAGVCEEMTDFIINLTASATGNTVPVPSLGSLFERTIPGTTTATFTAELYRDKEKAKDDLCWKALQPGVTGIVYIARMQAGIPVALDEIEAWQIAVTSAVPSALTSNTPASFTLTCAVPNPPNMTAIVSAT